VFWTDLILHYGGVEQFMGTNTQIGVECVISACIAFVLVPFFRTVTTIFKFQPQGSNLLHDPNLLRQTRRYFGQCCSLHYCMFHFAFVVIPHAHFVSP
jgi:hypothetical protein